MQLSPHFSLAEMTASQTATRRGIPNSPSVAEMRNLTRVAEVLEQVRALVNAPIVVSSGYRSPRLNAAVGGTANSAHVLGLAADINAIGVRPVDLAKRISESPIVFDQLIFEGSWVHIGLSDGLPRRQVLTANFDKVAGTTYTVGLP